MCHSTMMHQNKHASCLLICAWTMMHIWHHVWLACLASETHVMQAQQQLQQQRDRLQTGSFEEPENCSTALTLTLQSEPIKISSKEVCTPAVAH